MTKLRRVIRSLQWRKDDAKQHPFYIVPIFALLKVQGYLIHSLNHQNPISHHVEKRTHVLCWTWAKIKWTGERENNDESVILIPEAWHLEGMHIFSTLDTLYKPALFIVKNVSCFCFVVLLTFRSVFSMNTTHALKCL